jgi:hypothetical protein
MNSVDAAYKVLQEAGKPLHYVEIARRVIESKLWAAGSEAPSQTIKRDMDQEIRQLGNRARFTQIGSGWYATAPSNRREMTKRMPPELTFVAEAWGHLPVSARREVLRIVRAALTDQTGEIDDPVVASTLPHGPKTFPRDFLNPGIPAVRRVELPEEELAVRQLPDGSYVVESHFGFCHHVRNETEGMFIVYAHARGARALGLPDEMIHLFKAVKAYEEYLRTLWRDLYHAYGRECGDQAAACNHTKTAFDTLGLLLPAEALSPAPADTVEPTQRKRKQGTRTPETAFYMPILQALNELGGAGRTAEVVRRVGEIMDGALLPQDREPLKSTGVPRWDNTSRFARQSMVRNDLLTSDSPWGIWEMSDKGREYLSLRGYPRE